MLGVVNVRLALIYSTLLFLSREAFRKAALSGAVLSFCLDASSSRSWIALGPLFSRVLMRIIVWHDLPHYHPQASILL